MAGDTPAALGRDSGYTETAIGYKGVMAFVRTLARPMLSAAFIAGGVNQLREPSARAKRAEPVTDLISRSIPRAPRDPELLVRINGATQVGVGVLFGLGKCPRLSALVLSGSLAASTAGNHRFWEEKDAAQRADQQSHFLKNVGLLGGLLFAAVAGRGRRKKAGRTGPPRTDARAQERHRKASKKRSRSHPRAARR